MPTDKIIVCFTFQFDEKIQARWLVFGTITRYAVASFFGPPCIHETLTWRLAVT